MKHISRSRKGFTLIEILIVIGIIMLLAAIIFPAFSRAQESARQASCASNLQQIYQGVRLYYNDEKAYPENLVALLGEGMTYATAPTGTSGTLGAANAPNYIQSDAILLCPNDTFSATYPRSSYGPRGYYTPTTTLFAPYDTAATPSPIDVSLHVWNYWGYGANGYSYPTGTNTDASTSDGTVAAPNSLLRNPTAAYTLDPVTLEPTNPIKLSLSNRFAPDYTIITHCIHHRPQTSAGIRDIGQLYHTSHTAGSKLARDIVLRLDGTAKPLDVSLWNAPASPNSKWQTQTP